MTSPLVFLTRRRLVTRLLVTQALVLVVGLLTSWVVAAAVGPLLFQRHLQQKGDPTPYGEVPHSQDAYASASLIALGVSLVTVLLIALGVSVYLTRRIQRPLTELADAADDVAHGRYVRVPASGIGAEFDQLATAFNQMADRLDHVEDTRRRLLSDLAHELRTPVTTLEGYLEGLEDGVVDWDEQTAQVMREQARRLIRLIEDIDDVSRAEEGQLPLEPAETRVADLLWSASAAARDRYARKGVNLGIDLQGAEGRSVVVDAQRMGQVLANLLGNALRHTPPGGTVELTAQPRGEQVTVVVTDNGDGIGAEQLPHLFERFYRGDSARDRDHGGTGIGLTISKAITEAHHGRLVAESAGPGQGARFSVVLPVVAARPGRAAKSDHPVRP